MRSIWCLVAVVAISMGLAACQKPESGVPKGVAKAEMEMGPGGMPTRTEDVAPEFTVGDAETSIQLILELDAESVAENVKEEKVLTAKKLLSQSNVSVTPPAPASLWVRLRIKPIQPFVERAVVLRGVIERDGQPMASFNTVLGKYAMEDEPNRPKLFRIDALKDLPSLPSSVLLFARAEVLLAPEGANEDTIDPATMAAAPGDVSVVISNPLRVNAVLPGVTALPEQAPAPAKPATPVDLLAPPAPAAAQ